MPESRSKSESMSTDLRKTPSEGFSSDGFITDQDCFSSVRYRTMHADVNGCGFIAAYNLRHCLGQEAAWEEVREELDTMHLIRLPGPTLVRVMRQYLSKYVPELRETSGREAAIAAAKRSRAGIFRYREGNVPHFISYVRTEEGSFRFFNVDDGLEDFTTDLDHFAEEHFLHGMVIAFTVE